LGRRIDADHTRFRQIVQGKIRRDLRKYVSRGELIGKVGKDKVSIPLPQIELPRFRFGSRDEGGVGAGEGEPGMATDEGEGAGEAGEQPGEHALEIDVTLPELAQILGDELELPRIEPKGKKELSTKVARYTGIRKVGPASLRHFKRTYREALKRQIASGDYDPKDPKIIPIAADQRFRSWKVTEQPDSNAVLIYCMDVSGSMGDEQKEIVRITAFWIDTWLRSQYKNLETRYIVHDAAAKEVDQHTFYHLRESGGTKISSAYELLNRMIQQEYGGGEWNIYPFHFSDGDNWGTDDTTRCLDLLDHAILPMVNLFCYGQVKSTYGSGKFKKDLDDHLGGNEYVISADVLNRDGILDAIKDFLGKGK
jgi:uncharacterized sporulation protein YeaH/YhbH (DUF444 family)